MDVTEFLKSRGVPEDILEKVEKDKIDRDAILAMDLEDLKNYIPAYGDRVALLAFCKTATNQSSEYVGLPRSDVLERLRNKLKRKNKSCPTYLAGNSNAKKRTRRVELGWLDFDDSIKMFKQSEGTSKVFVNDSKKDDTYDSDSEVEMGTPTDLAKKTFLQLNSASENAADSAHKDKSIPEDVPAGSMQENAKLSLKRTRPMFFKNRRLSLHNQSRKPAESCSIDVENVHADDQEDADLQAAIRASLQEEKTEMKTFEDRLKSWTLRHVRTCAEPIVLLIYRDKLFESTKRAISRKSFDWCYPIKVAFSGELAEDLGGPKREFFSLLLKELNKLLLDNGTFQKSVQKLDKKDFLFGGKCVVWSVLHGGPGFPFLNLKVLKQLCDKDVAFTESDVTDYDIKEIILKLREAKTLTPDLSDWLIDRGIQPTFGPNFEEDQKQYLINLVIKYYGFYRTHAELTQFKEGLRMYDFLETFKIDDLECVLCPSQNIKTLTEVKAMIKINFSQQGSNNRKYEDDTVYAFEVFLQDCLEKELDVEFRDLLSFWTGSEEVPPMGFDKKLEINFVAACDRLPVAHTCEMSLELPRGLSPEELQRKLTKAIQWGGQFHLV